MKKSVVLLSSLVVSGTVFAGTTCTVSSPDCFEETFNENVSFSSSSPSNTITVRSRATGNTLFTASCPTSKVNLSCGSSAGGNTGGGNTGGGICASNLPSFIKALFGC